MRVPRAALACLLTPVLLAGCADGPNDDSYVYITSAGCDYDTDEDGIRFAFTVTGAGDADIVAEVHQSAPDADEHSPGPVIAEQTVQIRDGEPRRASVVVPLDPDQYDPKTTECLLQTENLGDSIETRPRATR